MIIKATERYMYGFMDIRGFYASADNVVDLPRIMSSVFPTEARLRGWDMEIYDLKRAQRGHQANGIVGVLGSAG